jgi:hypothetical protein
MNYAQLRAAIQNYAQDFESSFVENIDNFIRLAESRIMLRVRLPNFRKDVTAALIASNNLLAVPSDFLAPDSLTVITPNGLCFPQNKDPEFLDECYPNPAVVGVPRFYAYLNETALKLGPTPDQSYPVSMGYFYQAPSIVDVSATWLGDHFAHALVTGSLVEAAQYQKSEDGLFTRYNNAFELDLAMDLQHAKGRTKKDTREEPDQRVPV